MNCTISGIFAELIWSGITCAMSTPVPGTWNKIDYPLRTQGEHLAKTRNGQSVAYHLLSLLSKHLNDISSQLIQEAVLSFWKC